MAVSSSFLSPPTQFIFTNKFSITLPPSSVTFHQSPPITASSIAERATTITSPSSMYEVLGINMGASCQEIKVAYHKLARISHPDDASKGWNDSTAAAADEFIRIHVAYATLSDPCKRAEYDPTLFLRQKRPTLVRVSTSSSRFSGYTTGRNWETDQCW